MKHVTEEYFVKHLVKLLHTLEASIRVRQQLISRGLTKGDYLPRRERELTLLKNEKLHRTIIEASK
jgi:hypothetical protein